MPATTLYSTSNLAVPAYANSGDLSTTGLVGPITVRVDLVRSFVDVFLEGKDLFGTYYVIHAFTHDEHFTIGAYGNDARGSGLEPGGRMLVPDIIRLSFKPKDFLPAGTSPTITASVTAYPLPAAGAGATNPSVGATGAVAPTSATEIAGVDSGGLLRPFTAAIFHNSDNQAISGTSYGLLAGGVAQLLNAAGNLDRQRAVSTDGTSGVGVTTGATSMAMGFKTSIALSITANAAPQAVTPAVMSGTIGGVAWSIQVGQAVVVDTGSNAELVYISAVTATTFTAVFAKNHTGPVQVIGLVYNLARDAAGEADGATGIGTQVAAEYEYNAGGPGGGNFDRARSLQAKGRTSTAITAGGGAGSTSLTVASAGTIKAGMQVLLLKSTTFPAAGSFEAVYVDRSYVEGTTTIPLLSAIVAAVGYDTISYDTFTALGPGLSGFLLTGIGIEEEAVYDPVSGLFFIERSATQDGVAPQNVVIEAPGLWNGSSIDRERGNVDLPTLVASPITASVNSADQTNYNGRGVKIVISITAVSGAGATLVLAIQGKDVASGVYYTILATANITAAGTTVLEIYPAIATAANSTQGVTLPRTWRVALTVSGTTPSFTGTIGASMIV